MAFSHPVFRRSLICTLCFMLCVIGCLAPHERSASAASVRRPSAAPLVYVAIGASDAVGYGADDPTTENWPFLLSQHFPSSASLVNLGIPGVTTQQAAQWELPVALDAHPRLVTIWLAVNDLEKDVPLSVYTRFLRDIVVAIHHYTPAVIMVANIPDLTDVPYFQSPPHYVSATTISIWNRAIATVAHQAGAILVDLHAQWRQLSAHPEYIGSDGLHPSAAGYQSLANLFWTTLSHSDPGLMGR